MQLFPRDVLPSLENCPQCGGRRLGFVRPIDIEVAPLDPDDSPVYPGMRECKDCQAIIQVEP